MRWVLSLSKAFFLRGDDDDEAKAGNAEFTFVPRGKKAGDQGDDDRPFRCCYFPDITPTRVGSLNLS